MNKGIIISADKLKKNNPKKNLLNNYVNDLSYKINSAIDNAYKNNQTELLFNLPISFNIPPNINHKDFQLEVYFNIIEILEKKGYSINIKILKNETVLKINWIYSDNNDLNDMKKKIKSIMF
jgi:hypothetical protein